MQLPGPVRAVIGLAASAAQEARHLPDRAIELPMLAVSTALQLSLRAQQRYAMLEARGDEVLNGGQVTDEPPAWATFDDDPTDDESLQRLTGAGDGRDAAAILDDIFGGLEEDLTPPTPITAATGTSAKKASAKKSAAKRAEAKRTAAKSTAAKSTAAKSTAAKRAPAKSVTRKNPAKKPAGKKPAGPQLRTGGEGGAAGAGKGVNKPKHTKPSKFDDAGS